VNAARRRMEIVTGEKQQYLTLPRRGGRGGENDDSTSCSPKNQDGAKNQDTPTGANSAGNSPKNKDPNASTNISASSSPVNMNSERKEMLCMNLSAEKYKDNLNLDTLYRGIKTLFTPEKKHFSEVSKNSVKEKLEQLKADLARKKGGKRWRQNLWKFRWGRNDAGRKRVERLGRGGKYYGESDDFSDFDANMDKQYLGSGNSRSPNSRSPGSQFGSQFGNSSRGPGNSRSPNSPFGNSVLDSFNIRSVYSRHSSGSPAASPEQGRSRSPGNQTF
jgi:hypothetical protein